MSKLFKTLLGDFCGLCGAILPMPTDAPSDVSCVVCDSIWIVKAKNNVLVSTSFKNYEPAYSSADVDGDGDASAVVDHICSKCGHGKATFSTLQTRSADEGQTVFFTCVKCKKKDIEYS
ncbi:unnamed protein product [Auanema sp. JU1783]|nr:unnamed protein product [Auanema sp. JU1783]